ncbi:MAG TPA: hypothetical protein VNA25_20770 [Phycisphaerae bacterium]|nr:hypothetical protein [Phycisphaerae bacterium]
MCAVALMNGEQLVALLAAYGIGVKRQLHNFTELDDETDGGAEWPPACP